MIPSIKPMIPIGMAPIPQVRIETRSMINPSFEYPKMNLWIPRAPKRMPQMPAAILLPETSFCIDPGFGTFGNELNGSDILNAPIIKSDGILDQIRTHDGAYV